MKPTKLLIERMERWWKYAANWTAEQALTAVLADYELSTPAERELVDAALVWVRHGNISLDDSEGFALVLAKAISLRTERDQVKDFDTDALRARGYARIKAAEDPWRTERHEMEPDEDAAKKRDFAEMTNLGDDPVKWATACADIMPKVGIISHAMHPHLRIGWLTAWFANAMRAAKDAERNKEMRDKEPGGTSSSLSGPAKALHPDWSVRPIFWRRLSNGGSHDIVKDERIGERRERAERFVTLGNVEHWFIPTTRTATPGTMTEVSPTKRSYPDRRRVERELAEKKFT